MKVLILLSLATLACALSEHVINKRVLPTNENCDPDSETCRKGDWIARHIADCYYYRSFPHIISCDAENDALSWTVNVAVGDRCKPSGGKRFKCGSPGTNTRCVCSDTNLVYNPGFNRCKCQYWPPEDVGANSPAFCTGYYVGGKYGVHHWACCNNCKDPTSKSCDATTWQGGSEVKYCGSCGQNTGGRVEYYFNCGSCTTQQTCSSKCSTYDRAGFCWRWLDCFKGCCLESAKQPKNKRDTSELSFCGDGTCTDGETPELCPGDCCYKINNVNCTSNISKCTPACCRIPQCCLGDSNNDVNNGSNKGITVGIPVMVIMIISVIIIAILAIVYHIRKKRSLKRSTPSKPTTSNVLKPTVPYTNL